MRATDTTLRKVVLLRYLRTYLSGWRLRRGRGSEADRPPAFLPTGVPRPPSPVTRHHAPRLQHHLDLQTRRPGLDTVSDSDRQPAYLRY